MKDLRYYYKKAVKNHFALGALNFNNLESLQGLVEAAKNQKSPIIIAVSESALNYMGDYTLALADVARKNKGVFLHLDHGRNYAICKKAIDLGFDSVMIDGSALPFDENIKLTKKVVAYAHKKGVLVEGELGQLKGIEDNVKSENQHFTNPIKAKEFVEKTKVDTLAISIGTSHGAYKFQGDQTLRFDILEQIENALPLFPLVLHGASTVNPQLIQEINNYGGKIKKAVGIPEELLIKAVREHNIVKINSDTDFRLAMTAETRKILNEFPLEIDPRKYLGKGRERIKQVAEEKIKRIFNSSNKI